MGHLEQISVKFQSKYKQSSIRQNEFENSVCKMSVILSGSLYVKLIILTWLMQQFLWHWNIRSLKSWHCCQQRFWGLSVWQTLITFYGSLLLRWCHLLTTGYLSVDSQESKCPHFDWIFIIGCTGSCHFDNFQCSQWWKFNQNDNFQCSQWWKFSSKWWHFHVSVHHSSLAQMETFQINMSINKFLK